MIIKAKNSGTLSDLLIGVFESASRTTVKKIISHGNVKVNGKMVTNPSVEIKPGDSVEYTRQLLIKSKIKPPFPILFEDDALLVTEKPAGILTIGDRGTGGTSFYKMMSEFIRERSQGKEKLFVVHRLDREVSGLILLAKSEELQQKIKEAWPQTQKLYYALVEGHPKKEAGTIRSWLKEGGDQRVASVGEKEDAKLAVTHYRLLDKAESYSLLEIRLETGRKNQIRVHLSEMGCPVVGDRRYGADARFERRIRLHAFYLSLPHPRTGKVLEFKSKMPRGFLVLKPEDEKYK